MCEMRTQSIKTVFEFEFESHFTALKQAYLVVIHLSAALGQVIYVLILHPLAIPSLRNIRFFPTGFLFACGDQVQPEAMLLTLQTMMGQC